MDTLLIIRHAEKPDDNHSGIDFAGGADDKSLTPRGWQRAGAWVQLFQPALYMASALPTPDAIFASGPISKSDKKAGVAGSRSQRPRQTVTPLAQKLGISLNIDYVEGEEAELVATASTAGRVVLVCWQHEKILAIANALVPTPEGLPGQWPPERFNVLFRFDRSGDGKPWSFRQVVPVMFRDDKSPQI